MKRAGDRLGKYEIERSLGEGGAGAVYLARDTQLGRRVALKLLHAHFAEDEGMAARFRVEAEAMARLNHPNVTTVHDLVSDRGDWAIVMELVEGGESLATLLAREGRLDTARVIRFAKDAARGLAHAHARGIIHRDVKPANLLVTRDGREEHVKVTDFGIARLVGGETRTQRNVTLGTLYYLAPEQASNSSVDERADLYSLGVTIYECLVGHVPFQYKSAPQLLHAHVHEAPVAPTLLGVDVDPALEVVVGRLLAKDPASRPQTAEALVQLLEQLASPRSSVPMTWTGPAAWLSTSHLPAQGAPAAPPLSVPPAFGAAPSYAPVSHPAQAQVSQGYPSNPPASTDSGLSEETRMGVFVSIGIVLFAVCVCLFGVAMSCLVTSR